MAVAVPTASVEAEGEPERRSTDFAWGLEAVEAVECFDLVGGLDALALALALEVEAEAETLSVLAGGC